MKHREPAPSLPPTFAYSAFAETPLGSLLLCASDGGLIVCDFVDRSEDLLLWMERSRIQARPAPPEESPPLNGAQRWLEAYFAGRPLPEAPPLDLRGTEFQHSVCLTLQSVGWGQTISYGELSQRLARSMRSAAVGRALQATPLVLFVPSHRVADLHMRFPAPARAVERHRRLRLHELAQQRRIAGSTLAPRRVVPPLALP